MARGHAGQSGVGPGSWETLCIFSLLSVLYQYRNWAWRVHAYRWASRSITVISVILRYWIAEVHLGSYPRQLGGSVHGAGSIARESMGNGEVAPLSGVAVSASLP
ncbi:hypothetical protein N7471_002251 [Penicillium samsonianum]|uniref:uncharacterized protein n=1 Tax=Penicillium samsonianum TaxID=1882272 RepID=UPI002547498F|nr:uncharacterized protein N7471_002251 [Penicillium samsonianum]KAJ6142798.1 hypothetical protein N7471_002251 [Penicillium samsonianum]